MIAGSPSESERLKYIDLIQAVITRQASNAFLVKGWALTVAAAFYGYVASHLSWEAAATSLLPTVGFYYLDAFYLRQERLFRALWNDVVGNQQAVALFSMDTTAYKSTDRCTWLNVVLRSWHLIAQYGLVLAVGILLLIHSAAR